MEQLFELSPLYSRGRASPIKHTASLSRHSVLIVVPKRERRLLQNQNDEAQLSLTALPGNGDTVPSNH